LRRSGIRSDNLVLVPGNLLAQKRQWQAVANRLPAGDVLIVRPSGNTPAARVAGKTSMALRAVGRRVWVLPASSLTEAL
jgi:hypothetical protein